MRGEASEQIQISLNMILMYNKSHKSGVGEMLKKYKLAKNEVVIGLVGKYVELPDAYISVVESLNHGGIYNNAKVKIK